MESNNGPTGPFSAGPGTHGCQPCQNGDHAHCEWILAIERANEGEWDHHGYVSLPSYGYCTCATADEDMHLDPRDPDEEDEIDEETEDEDGDELVSYGDPELSEMWEVIFHPYETTPVEFEQMSQHVSDLAYGGGHPFSWTWNASDSFGTGSREDRELIFTWDVNSPLPEVPIFEGPTFVEAREATLGDFQRDCTRLMASLGYEGWTSAQRIISAIRPVKILHIDNEQEPASP
jgi:hypothetical protein